MLTLCDVYTVGLFIAGTLHLLYGLPESGNLFNGVQVNNSEIDNQSTYSTLFTGYIYNNPNMSDREYFIRPVQGTRRSEQNGGFSQQNTTQQKQPISVYQQTLFLGQKANDQVQQTSISQQASSPEKQSDVMRPERQINPTKEQQRTDTRLDQQRTDTRLDQQRTDTRLDQQRTDTRLDQQRTDTRLDQQKGIPYNSDIPGIQSNRLLQQLFAQEQAIIPVLNKSAELNNTRAGKLRQLINFLMQNRRITGKQVNDAYQKTNTFGELLRSGELQKGTLPNISVQTSNATAELTRTPILETLLSGQVITNPFQEAMFQTIGNQVNQTLGTILPLSILGTFPSNTEQQTRVSAELNSGPVEESSSQTEEVSGSSQQVSNEEKQPNKPILPIISNEEMPVVSFNQTNISRRDPSSLIQDTITKGQANIPIKTIIQERNQTNSQVQQAIELIKQTLTNALPQYSPAQQALTNALPQYSPAQQAFSQSEQMQTNTLVQQSSGPIQQTDIQIGDAGGSNQQTASPSEQEEANVPEETLNSPLKQTVMQADPNQTISFQQQMSGKLSGVNQLIDTTSEQIESNIPEEQSGGPLQQTGMQEEEKQASGLGEKSGSVGNQTITDAEEQNTPAQQTGSQIQNDTRGKLFNLFNDLIQQASIKLEQTTSTNQQTINIDQPRTNISVEQPIGSLQRTIVQNDQMPQSSKWEQLKFRNQQIINKTEQLSDRMLETSTIWKPQETNIREDRSNGSFQQTGIQGEQQQINVLKQQNISPVISNVWRNITGAQQQQISNLYPINIQGDQKQTSTIWNQSSDQNQQTRNQKETLNSLIQPADLQREGTNALTKQTKYPFQQTDAQNEQWQSRATWENLIGRIKPTNIQVGKPSTFSQQADDMQKQNKATTLMEKGGLKQIGVFGEQVIIRDQQQNITQVSKPGQTSGLNQITGTITKQEEANIQTEKPSGLFLEQQPNGRFQQTNIEAEMIRVPLKPTGTQKETEQLITSQEQLYGQNKTTSIQSAKPSESSKQAGATKEQEANTQEEQAGGPFQQSGTQQEQNQTISLREEATGRALQTNLPPMETSTQMGRIKEQVQKTTLNLIEQQTSGPFNRTFSDAQSTSGLVNKTIWDAQKQNSVVQQTVAQGEQDASSNILEQSSNIGQQASPQGEQQEANEEQLNGSLQQSSIPEEQNRTRVQLQQSVDSVKQAITNADQVSSIVKQSEEMPTSTIRKQPTSVPQQSAVQVGQQLDSTQQSGTQSEQQEANMEEVPPSVSIQKSTVTNIPTRDYITSTIQVQLSDVFRLPNIQGVQLRGFSTPTNINQENKTYVASQQLIAPFISTQQRLVLLEQARNQIKQNYIEGKQQNITDQQYSAKEDQTQRGTIGQQSSGLFPQENTQGLKLSVLNQHTGIVTEQQLNTQEQPNTIAAQPRIFSDTLNVPQQPRAPESQPSSLYVPVTTSPLREPLRILGQPQPAYIGPIDAQRIKPALESYACPKYKYRVEGNAVIFEGIERGCNLIVDMASVIRSVSKDMNEPLKTIEPRRIDKSDVAEMRTADGTIAANGECPGWHIWTTRLAIVHIQTSPICHIVVHLGKKIRGSTGGRPLRVMYARMNRLNGTS